MFVCLFVCLLFVYLFVWLFAWQFVYFCLVCLCSIWIVYFCMSIIIYLLCIVLFFKGNFSSIVITLIQYGFGECSALRCGHGSFVTHTPLILLLLCLFASVWLSFVFS